MATEPLPRFSVGAPEHLRLGSASVPALLVRPDTPGSYPAAIIQHGFGAEKFDLLPLALVLATYGFVVLLPDAWEHGERQPDTGPRRRSETSADYFLDVVRHTAADMCEALTILSERPEVREEALLVGGFSMGGITALMVGTEDPRVAAVAALAGSPLPDLLSVSLTHGAMPSEASARWAREHDAVVRIARFAPRPLLLSHGRADDMVPVAGTLRLYEAAKPHYTGFTERLTLHLYDHTHTVSETQLRDAVNWLAAFFIQDDAA